MVDGVFELGDAVKGTSANHAFGDQSEPALYLIKPGAAGGGEVNVEAKALLRFEPTHHLSALVGAVVVHNEVNLQIRRHCLFPLGEELDKLPTAMTGRQHPITLPLRMLNAANRVVVPCRL